MKKQDIALIVVFLNFKTIVLGRHCRPVSDFITRHDKYENIDDFFRLDKAFIILHHVTYNAQKEQIYKGAHFCYTTLWLLLQTLPPPNACHLYKN